MVRAASCRHRQAVERDAASIGFFEERQAAQQRRFPGAARTDDDHDLALRDVEVDAIEDFVRAELLVEVAHLDDCHFARAQAIERAASSVARAIPDPSRRLAEQPVDDGDFEEDGQGLKRARNGELAVREKLAHGNHRDQRTVLDEADEGIANRRKRRADQIAAG